MAPSTTSGKPTVAELISKSPAEIISFLGGIYEHSQWVAERFVANRTSAEQNSTGDADVVETVTDLARQLRSIVDASDSETKLNLLLAHPDLCEKVGKLEQLTQESQEEQSRSGLQALTEAELAEFTELNTTYRARNGFPFILAVRNATKYIVLSALRGRSNSTSTRENEFHTAMQQVHKIAWMRLLAALDTSNAKGFLTCHVLDTANGIPADGMRIHLERLSPPETAGLIGEFVTNNDGRLDGGPALKGGTEFTVGVYQWTFYTGEYFASKGTFTSGQPFLDVVPIRFGIDNPDDHYHVPLLVSPWSFSTYRGS